MFTKKTAAIFRIYALFFGFLSHWTPNLMCATTKQRRRVILMTSHAHAYSQSVSCWVFFSRVGECNSKALCFLTRGVHQKQFLGHSFVECLSNSETQFLFSPTPQAFRAARERELEIIWNGWILCVVKGSFQAYEICGILGFLGLLRKRNGEIGGKLDDGIFSEG
jgi:hypothetical protein